LEIPLGPAKILSPARDLKKKTPFLLRGGKARGPKVTQSLPTQIRAFRELPLLALHKPPGVFTAGKRIFGSRFDGFLLFRPFVWSASGRALIKRGPTWDRRSSNFSCHPAKTTRGLRSISTNPKKTRCRHDSATIFPDLRKKGPCSSRASGKRPKRSGFMRIQRGAKGGTCRRIRSTPKTRRKTG